MPSSECDPRQEDSGEARKKIKVVNRKRPPPRWISTKKHRRDPDREVCCAWIQSVSAAKGRSFQLSLMPLLYNCASDFLGFSEGFWEGKCWDCAVDSRASRRS